MDTHTRPTPPPAFDGAIEFRSHKDPAFDLVRKEADIGLQVSERASIA